ncbi:MAG: hypothetical protein IPM81_08615 [Saprospirales bacterium]|nr:hypothetical protein [Saprospirales bacterium]
MKPVVVTPGAGYIVSLKRRTNSYRPPPEYFRLEFEVREGVQGIVGHLPACKPRESFYAERFVHELAGGRIKNYRQNARNYGQGQFFPDGIAAEHGDQHGNGRVDDARVAHFHGQKQRQQMEQKSEPMEPLQQEHARCDPAEGDRGEQRVAQDRISHVNMQGAQRQKGGQQPVKRPGNGLKTMPDGLQKVDQRANVQQQLRKRKPARRLDDGMQFHQEPGVPEGAKHAGHLFLRPEHIVARVAHDSREGVGIDDQKPGQQGKQCDAPDMWLPYRCAQSPE